MPFWLVLSRRRWFRRASTRTAAPGSANVPPRAAVSPLPALPTADPAERKQRWQVTAPSWLVSLVLHALLVIVLGYATERRYEALLLLPVPSSSPA